MHWIFITIAVVLGLWAVSALGTYFLLNIDGKGTPRLPRIWKAIKTGPGMLLLSVIYLISVGRKK